MEMNFVLNNLRNLRHSPVHKIHVLAGNQFLLISIILLSNFHIFSTFECIYTVQIVVLSSTAHLVRNFVVKKRSSLIQSLF